MVCIYFNMLQLIINRKDAVEKAADKEGSKNFILHSRSHCWSPCDTKTWDDINSMIKVMESFMQWSRLRVNPSKRAALLCINSKRLTYVESFTIYHYLNHLPFTIICELTQVGPVCAHLRTSRYLLSLILNPCVLAVWPTGKKLTP